MRRTWAAFLIGISWVLVAWLPELLLPDRGVGVLPPIDLRQAALFAASAVFGAAGWVGAAVAYVATIPHPLGGSWWTVVALLPLVGALAWAILPRRLPHFDRSLRAPAALGGVVVLVVVWSAAAAYLQAKLVFPGASGPAWLLWTVTSLCTLLLGSIPVVVAAELVRLSRASGQLLADVRRLGAGGVAIGVAAIVSGVAVHHLAEAAPFSRMWIALLLLAPVVFAARRWATAGGVIVAAVGGSAYLQAAAVAGPSLSSHYRVVELAGLVLTLWVVGALLGAGGWRQLRLIERLRAQQALLERDLDRVVRALSRAVEAKDEYTEGHLQRVTRYANKVGAALGLDSEALEMLRLASTLHDVGKIGIPGSILRKPGPLTEDEQHVMMRHAEIGSRLLAQLEGFEGAAALVLHHQERFDGRRDGPFPGYPLGLRGEQIPLGARIIAVVDAFDAMTSDRPYRRALPLERAIEVLVRERGAQFDPRVVDVFLEQIEREPWIDRPAEVERIAV